MLLHVRRYLQISFLHHLAHVLCWRFQRTHNKIGSYASDASPPTNMHIPTRTRQVKAEKIDTLKRAREMEERQHWSFEPQLNPTYQLKEPSARTAVSSFSMDEHVCMHSDNNACANSTVRHVR